MDYYVVVYMTTATNSLKIFPLVKVDLVKNSLCPSSLPCSFIAFFYVLERLLGLRRGRGKAMAIFFRGGIWKAVVAPTSTKPNHPHLNRFSFSPRSRPWVFQTKLLQIRRMSG